MLLSTAVMVMDDDSHPARVDTTLGSTTAAVSDDPRWPMLSIRDEHLTSVSSPICNQEDDTCTLFDYDIEAGTGMRDRAITQRESIPIEMEAGAAVVGCIPRKDKMERGEQSARIVLLRVIRRAVGWLQTGLWTRPLCLLRTIGRRLLTMISITNG